MNWLADVKNLQKAMYRWNMVQGRKNFYSEDYMFQIDMDLQNAAMEVASWVGREKVGFVD